MTRRIERAMTLLRQGDLSVTEVCFTVGCGSLGTFSTRDLDRVFTDLRTAGVEVVQEPTEQFYGVRDCAVRDPAGTLLRINERP
jgi:uncharacterized glyoxalase superfamily protein PhnB